jgi:ABC-type Fe3+ transport system permease subunit
METLNDICAVEFFGVRTLTVAVYDTWLDRNSLAGAAQIACVMLLFVFALLLIERALRAKRRFGPRRLERGSSSIGLRSSRAARLCSAGFGACP